VLTFAALAPGAADAAPTQTSGLALTLLAVMTLLVLSLSLSVVTWAISTCIHGDP